MIRNRKSSAISLLLSTLILPCSVTLANNDWAQFSIYQNENSTLMNDTIQSNIPVIFIGNSITEGWVKEDPRFFKNNNFIGRGISGQTTYQMLVRFRDDVINLHPQIVVINGGTNDVAENNHTYNEDRTLGNIISMTQLAMDNGIDVILSSVLPSDKFGWRDTIPDVANKIKSLNERIKDFAFSSGIDYIDYYNSMTGQNGELNKNFTKDGVHPNFEGYKVMEEVALPIIMQKLKASAPIEISLWEDISPQYSNGLSKDAEKVENADWITLVTDPKLYVYPSSHPNGTAIIMCPGGGYYGLAIEHEGKQLAKLLNENGVTLAVLKYRMPNGNSEVPLEDGKRAIEILNERAEEWGIDTKRIGIAGASAGGHLAASLATSLSTTPLSPAFQVLLYPVITMDNSFTHSDTRANLLGKNPSDDKISRYSNEKQVTSQTPPAFITLSANDDLVPVENSLSYFEALNKEGVPVALFVYPSGGHGWGYSPGFKYNEEWTSELINWLNNLELKE